MKRWLVGLAGLALLGLTGPAHADDDDMETVTGRSLPPTGIDEPAEVGHELLTPEQYQALQDRPYPPVVYRGAEALSLEPEYVHQVREGLEYMYRRDYNGARDYFADLDQEYPGRPLASVVNTLVWQAIMLENFDFKYDDQYWVSSAQARRDLEGALEVPGGEGWEHFLMAGMVGIEAIHTMRREKYLPALQLAFEAMDHAQRSREAAPDFVDMLLADGMYNYWRSVLTITTKVLPDFGDERVLGIQQLQAVERGGVFLGPPATLALAFTWLEERELKRAISSCLRNKRAYPNNVVNNLMLGQTYTYMRRFDAALEAYDRILTSAPDNKRVHYYRGVTLMRMGRSPEAEQEFLAYLGFDYMEDYQRAAATYRLGQVYYRQKQYERAHDQFKAAVKMTGYKPAKRKLERMKQLKKQGRIDY